MCCRKCGKQLTKKQIRRKKKYCSIQCCNKDKNMVGINNPMYGKKQKQSTKEKISKANKKKQEDKVIRKHTCKYCGKEFINKRKNAIYCRKRCSELDRRINKRCKICNKLVKRPSRDTCSKKCAGIHKTKKKPKCIICGKECAHTHSKHCSRDCKAITDSRNRIKFVKSRLKKGQKLSPFYNKKACEWFRRFDKRYNTQGQHAETKDGERLIFPYWVDYINDDIKLIIEWNEKQHYKKDGQLKEKDYRKMEVVLEKYEDYEYCIINEDTMTIKTKKQLFLQKCNKEVDCDRSL